MRPGPDVLAAFGAHADPVPLPGGADSQPVSVLVLARLALR